MASGVGTTTVATNSTGAQGLVNPSDLTLAWMFPQPSRLPVGLHWAEAAERVIGREEDCSIHLTGNDVSRRHAVLRRDDTGLGAVVVDLGSRNGVYVNGQRVLSAPLRQGDVVRLGGWLGVVTDAPGAWKEIAPGLFGGAAMQSVLAPLQRAAASDLPIILEGETGTGKEVVTRSVHAWSGRSGPLVAVNCAALPEALAEGELFGYRRGAFTGADKPSPGFFRSADGGTLLLDEVTDLPLALQAKLLRVLEEHEVQPLGEPRPIPIDVRVVVAGQQSLLQASRQGRFRPDLLARLDGVTVHLPPLRSRREDVPPLFSHFLSELAQGCAPAVDIDFVERLCLHDWPFNVRELLLLARRLMVLHGGESTWRAACLPERIGDPSASRTATRSDAAQPLPDLPATAVKAGPEEPVELPALVAALRTSGGNVARAAAMLGITRQRAYRLMEGKAVDLEALRNPEQGPKEAGQ
jgi:transcriptional regulator with AAA-type ATPase domain